MKINIYYGGRGVLDDPTLYVTKKMENVLKELRVTVEHVNIYEYKNGIATLPNTMKGADGIILASTVEWLGIGGYMTQFLDACWLYGDKDMIRQIYMQPVVMSTTYGEREGMLTLENAWQILGGHTCDGLCGYVDDLNEFETNPEYMKIIEKRTESMYRAVSQKSKELPGSNQAVRQTVLHSQQMDLTPEESEQLSQFVSDDNYVRQQKADIEELSSLYRDMLGVDSDEGEYISDFKGMFNPDPDFRAVYQFEIEGNHNPLTLDVAGKKLTVKYGKADHVNVYARISPGVMDRIVGGRETFQRAFGVGDMTAKGNLRQLNMLDRIFPFSES